MLLEKDELRKLLQEYAEVFSDELGTITPVKAKLEVSPSGRTDRRPRQVVYALKPLVEQELDRLEQAGVLERVDYSDWAAPIVTVLKRDGCVRICGDYKVTINPALDIDKYPLPRPEDLFATLAGGKYFTTLDLSHAYNQLVLDDDARPYLTINTQKSCQQAFVNAKKKLLSPNVLVHYDPSRPIRLAADASAYGVGAVISHVLDDGSEHPIAFASRTLIPSERNYSQLEKETRNGHWDR